MARGTASGQKATPKNGTDDPPATLRRSTRARKSTRPFEQEEVAKPASTKAKDPEATAAESPKAQPDQLPKVAPAQSPKEPTVQSPKEATAQSPKETTAQSPKEGTAQSPKESAAQSQESAGESPNEPSPQSAKESSGQSPSEGSPQSDKESRAGSPKTPVADSPEETMPPRRNPKRKVTPEEPRVGSPKTTSIESPEEAAPIRRNPKRKVTPEVTSDISDLLNILDTSLEAWKENELEDWPSWAEVESDPELFNRILRLIGVKHAKIQELFGVDEASLSCLPEPLYGLIFLYEYCAPDEDLNPVEPCDGLWFANQTTSNACATVAMLNIIMNAEGLALGERLENFKQETQDLSPPLRGHKLSNCTWLRVAANSFCRRIDLLNSALYLQGKSDSSKKKGRATKKRKVTLTTSKKADTRKRSESAAYHFIAYVPLQNKVWQLDGLEKKPRCIGEYHDGEHWTSAVSGVLQEKMDASLTQQLGFSLLALHGGVGLDTEGEADEKNGRKKDHTPAIHEWVKKLAEHGVLRELAERVRRD